MCRSGAGRGVLLDPWIFRRLGDARFVDPTPDEQMAFLVRHFTLMSAQHGEYACVLFRKFAGWYGARLGIPEDLEASLRQFNSISEFDRLVEQIRLRHGERQCEVPTALLKVPNGPVEHW